MSRLSRLSRLGDQQQYACRTCNALVDKHAIRCPRCNRPDPSNLRGWQMSLLKLALMLAVPVLIVGGLVAFVAVMTVLRLLGLVG